MVEEREREKENGEGCCSFSGLPLLSCGVSESPAAAAAAEDCPLQSELRLFVPSVLCPRESLNRFRRTTIAFGLLPFFVVCLGPPTAPVPATSVTIPLRIIAAR